MLKISPLEHSMVRIEVIEWSNTEQKDICVGDFEVSSSNGQLKIQGFKDWITEQRNSIEVEYYINEPEFHKRLLYPFQGIYIKHISSVGGKTK